MSSKNPPASHRFHLHEGVDGIAVSLWDPKPPVAAATIVASFYHSTWGDLHHPDDWLPMGQVAAGKEDAWIIAQRAMAGEVLPNTLESISCTFGFSGISRATTHQLVRTRVGAVFGQQGGRDNNWSDFNLRLPETWWETNHPGILEEVDKLRKQANALYQVALKLGIPYQDARYVLPMGLETALVGSYNLLSVKSLLARRLCNRMMWETNWVARLMHDELVSQYPWIGRSLRSACETRGVCQSVSPMFPPACWTSKGGIVRSATDNPTLEEMVGDRGGFDFKRSANAAHKYGNDLDKKRLVAEINDPNIVMSLVSDKVLARRDAGGKWHAA